VVLTRQQHRDLCCGGKRRCTGVLEHAVVKVHRLVVEHRWKRAVWEELLEAWKNPSGSALF